MFSVPTTAACFGHDIQGSLGIFASLYMGGFQKLGVPFWGSPYSGVYIGVPLFMETTIYIYIYIYIYVCVCVSMYK